MSTTHGTMVDSVGRARHSLNQMHDPGSATVTVHGLCPIAECRTMNIVQVQAGTTSVTCTGCGTTFVA